MKVSAFKTLLVIFSLSLISPGYAQELDDFLACSNISDRVERAFCLESALEAATEESEGATQNNDSQVVNQDSSEGSRFRLPSIRNIFRRDRSDTENVEGEVVQENIVQEEISSRAQGTREESFGRPPVRQSGIATNEDGKDELYGVVASRELLNSNILQITLANGQVWLQTHAKRFSLKAGDDVRIYPTGWGDNLRLETERLSGFIQVVRVE